MASSTPPHCSITASSKPHKTPHPYPSHRTLQQPQHHHPRRFASQKVSASPIPSNSLSKAPTFLSPLPTPNKTHLSPDFSGKKSIRFVSKLDFNRQRSSLSARQSPVAEDVLHQATLSAIDEHQFENLLVGFEGKLSGSEDYCFLLRELGNRGESSKAVRCYEFAVQRERKVSERVGKMDLAFDIMSQMTSKNVMPNVVTYSTVIDGFAKAGRLEEALSMFKEMKCAGIALDRVCYNASLSMCLKLGRFKDSLNVCKEMESLGIRKDVVTYNALLGGFGKQGKYDEVRQVFEQMKNQRISPNVLTYWNLIDVYSKGGLYREAMEVFREFKMAGLKVVVLYSGLIDALCKNGLVKSAVLLLDEMTKEGIRPNVVTYNTIIDAFGRSARAEYLVDAIVPVGGRSAGKTSMILSCNSGAHNLEGSEHNRVMKIFGQLAAKKSHSFREFNESRQELLCILGLF